MAKRKLISSTKLLCTLGVCGLLLEADGVYASKPIVSNETIAINATVKYAQLLNPTTVEVYFVNNERMTMDFYGNNIVRLFMDLNGGIVRNPKAVPPAEILVENARTAISDLNIKENGGNIVISTSAMEISIDKATGLMKVSDLKRQKMVLEQSEPVTFTKENIRLAFVQHDDEYFYGGGMQNGRFSHKGQSIAIVNENSWTDGGVASPAPFYWSTAGYGVMFHTFKPGKYDFSAKSSKEVDLSHDTDYLDLFLMVNDGMVPLLNDYYQLTGHPVLLPKFGFYQGHLNAYNRDYWKEDEKGILFEDGKRYKESQKDNGGVKESLNGEKDNYQFSARAVIDRYRAHDMPLGWILPNDGYGAGYGQTETIDGNIANLKDFANYAHSKGVEVGLWTQSDLHPKEGVSALLQRDIVKEVRDAGVRVLKTDVAWVGAGYSFGLNGIADVSNIMSYYGNNSRPFIISLDGWAGTQRYAGIWSGDQTGGVWEYIRFHIPTYIGSGLSGQPNVGSDMDGIFGGKNPIVNMRDFQWKTYTPMELNMDGWGSNEKYPHALGEPATDVNRWYLKMKSALLPYSYSVAQEAVAGLPIIRPMFTEQVNAYTQGSQTQYQYMYGPSILVAPIYKATRMDKAGNDIRNTIYLPKGEWVDYFTGEQYSGDVILNEFDAPYWKLPVFVKRGAIIPVNRPNNSIKEVDESERIYEIYPFAHSSFTDYDDDGISEAYKVGACSKTVVESDLNSKGLLTITVHPTEGTYRGIVDEKNTEFRINITAQPKSVKAKINGKSCRLQAVNSLEALTEGENVYFYEETPDLNQFATPGSEFAKVEVKKNPVLYVRLGKVTTSTHTIQLAVSGYEYNKPNGLLATTGTLTGTLTAPQHVEVADSNRGAYTLTPSWDKVEGADAYEIEFEGMNYTGIRSTSLLFEQLNAATTYDFKVRAVNASGHSDWSTLSVQTKNDPLEHAIRGAKATTTAKSQEGYSLARVTDFDEKNIWHSQYQVKAVPFELIIDLKGVYTIDKIQYLPRTSAGNGNFLQGEVLVSADKKEWTSVNNFDWQNTEATKEILLAQPATVRYVKFNVTKAVGNYGTCKEIYVFKVPGSDYLIPGDVNNDKKLDHNDIVSYMNYTGLRRGDADFEGYISKGDINNNGMIDAFDISNVAVQIDGDLPENEVLALNGSIQLIPNKSHYAAGEEIAVRVMGVDMKDVNAMSFALPYNPSELEFLRIESSGLEQMENLTYDRLHTNGEKALYPTFVNIGDKKTISGSNQLFVLKFKAKKATSFKLKAKDGMLVDRQLHTFEF